jgi:bisphosphoglycerate-dependent phosphoglycerate mutase
MRHRPVFLIGFTGWEDPPLDPINRGKRVLITSRENDLRGILLHLRGKPEEAMLPLHISKGVVL